MRLPIYLILCLAATGAWSQEWKSLPESELRQVLEKAGALERTENYIVTFRNSIYADAADLHPLSVAQGTLFRGRGNEYRVESPGQLLIQTAEIKMVIDSAQRRILLLKPDTLFQLMDPAAAFASANIPAMQCLYRRDKTFDQYRITSSSPQGGVETLELWLDTRTSQLRRAELLLPAENYQSSAPDDQTQEHPKVVLEYDLPERLSASARTFDLSSWLRQEKGTWQPVPAAASFALEDLRIFTND